MARAPSPGRARSAPRGREAERGRVAPARGRPAASGEKRAGPRPAASTKRQRRASGERPRAQSAHRGRRGGEGDEDEDEQGDHDDARVPADLSRKIMREARAQQEEFEAEAQGSQLAARRSASAAKGFDDDVDSDMDDGEGLGFGGEDGEEEEEMEEVEVDEADEALLARLMPSETGARRTLADVIMEKLAEHTGEAAAGTAGVAGAGGAGGGGSAAAGGAEPLPDKVVQVYSSIGELLRRYRAGKLPKAFKIVPRLTNWEDVLFLTQPQGWSPQACAAATRIFASSLNPRMAQRFYALVLLPAVLDDIDANKRLNYHYYMALKKAVYKPAAFFKGIVLPMCEERCSLLHAMIVCSVLGKVSVPAMHSSVTLLKLTEMPLSGASILFMRTLLMKKYALPYRVVDALADYFAGFHDVDHELPVIWHQSLLVFAQHYKLELTQEQKEDLKPVLRKHTHQQITPEIRHELFTSACRGDPYIPEVDMI